MTLSKDNLPAVVSHEQWFEARRELLAEEKALTRARDELSSKRRQLPMVRIEKDYRFHGPNGEVGLIDIFDGRLQLLVQHFMFDPEWEEGCPSCTAGADEISEGMLRHIHTRDTTLALVSRAPYEKLERYKTKRGWTHLPWYSSFGSDFNYDFHVTLDKDVAPIEYNFRTWPELKEQGMEWMAEGSSEQPGHSVFLRVDDDVFHTYSSYARGAEWFGGSYAALDLTPLGRQEDWEEPKGRAQFAREARPDFAS